MTINDESQVFVDIDNLPLLTYLTDNLPKPLQRSFPDFQDFEFCFNQILQNMGGLLICEGKGFPNKEEDKKENRMTIISILLMIKPPGEYYNLLEDKEKRSN